MTEQHPVAHFACDKLPCLEYVFTARFKIGELHFRRESGWNGMEEWCDDKGRKLIVALAPKSGLAGAFGGLFGESSQPQSLTVYGGSPDLLDELGLIGGATKVGGAAQ